MRVLAAACLALISAALGVSVRVDATDCERLSTLALPNTTVTAAARVEAGAFTVGAQTYRSLPAFCRVAATLKPTQDSDIKIEVWLPQAGWNGKHGGGQRRLQRIDRLRRDGERSGSRLRGQFNRYRS